MARLVHITFVDFLNAVDACVARCAGAGVAVEFVVACGIVVAWVGLTFIDVNRTIWT